VSRATKARNRAGRPIDLDAKRRQTTEAGQGREAKGGTPELIARRQALCGDAKTGTDFPLDVMLTLRLISEDERDEGLRFAQLSWWLYGLPFAGPELLYERMVSGVVDADMAPRRELVMDDPELQVREVERIRRNKQRFERMVEALKRAAPRELVLAAVKRATQLLLMPRFLITIGTESAGTEDWYEMARLKRGLNILATLRDAEDRHWRRRHLPAVNTSVPRYT
jgi:hypothetical protein